MEPFAAREGSEDARERLGRTADPAEVPPLRPRDRGPTTSWRKPPEEARCEGTGPRGREGCVRERAPEETRAAEKASSNPLVVRGFETPDPVGDFSG